MAEQLTAPPRPTGPAIWPDWQKQIAAVLLLLLIPLVIYFLRLVLAPTLLTAAITFVLMYPVRWLQKFTKLSYRPAVLLVYLLFLIISLVAVGWFVVSAVTSLIDTLQSAREFADQLFAGVAGRTEGGAGNLLNLGFLSDGLKAMSVAGAGLSLLASPGEFFTAAFARLSGFTSFISGYAFVIILLLFMMLEWPRTANVIARRIPPESRREYAILIQRLINIGQNYLLGSLVIVLFYWAVTALLFWLSGVPYPVVLGLVVAIPNFIPQGGGLVSAILVFVITLVTGSTTFAINRLVFAFVEMAIFMLISGAAYYVVDVRIYSKSVNMPVWVILVGIMAFGAAMGV
ncbi:MAG: AI-2E family transporter, partial [Chloroflexi bacterium]